MLTTLFTVASLATLTTASPLAPHSLPSSRSSGGVLAPLHVPSPPPFLSRLTNPHSKSTNQPPHPNPDLFYQQSQQFLYDGLEANQDGKVRPLEERHLIPNGYIIKLKPSHHHKYDDHLESISSLHSEDVNHRSQLISVAKSTGDLPFHESLIDLGGIGRKYSIGKGFKGYSGKFSEEMVERIRGMEEVEFVEVDSTVWALDQHGEPLVGNDGDVGVSEVQKFVPWGLHRISHTSPIGFQTLLYEYDATAGTGVDAYIIDTGINTEHVELEGRAKWGKTFANDGDFDGNGHGSHVAGTVGSRRYGVSKNVNLIAVKVLGSGGSGSMSDVLSGVDYAAEQAEKSAVEAKQGKKKGHKGSVANMSLGGGKSPSLDLAVENAVEAGLHFAVAAGNDDRDACNSSPAAAPSAITVGASTIWDQKAYFSNHGSCVDVFAPGLNILSIWNSGNTSLNTISGTSMASPHVAGLLAYFLSLYPNKLDVERILKEADSKKSNKNSKRGLEDQVWNLEEEMVRIAGEAFEAGRKDLNRALESQATVEESAAQAMGWIQSLAAMLLGNKKSDGHRHTSIIIDIDEEEEGTFFKGGDDEDETPFLTPKALKKVVEHLSLDGVLEGLPEKTVNLLINNNWNSTA